MATYTLIGEDTFTVSVDTNLNVHTPTGTTPLSGWTKLTAATGSAQAVVESTDDTLTQPYIAILAANPYVISNAVNAGAQKCEATGVIDTRQRIVLYGANAATYWNGYAGRFNNSSGNWEIWRYDNGAATNIVATAGTTPIATDIVSFECESGVFSLKLNGVQKATITDSTYTTGKPGVAPSQSFGATGIDNFKAYHVAGGTTHTTSGAITGQGATVAGTAAHLTLHTTTGAITGQGSEVVGTASHLTLHATSGAITGQGATVSGVAVHPHTTSGAIVGQGATVDGTAAHLSLHTSSGAITGQGSEIAGTAAHTATGHITSGAITGQGSEVTGTAAHLSLHTTTGAITGQGATISGVAVHPHVTSGAITGQGATVTGTATNAGAMTLTQADIDAIATAVWAKVLSNGLTAEATLLAIPNVSRLKFWNGSEWV